MTRDKGPKPKAQYPFVGILEREKTEFKDFAIPLLFDAAKGSLVLAILVGFNALLRLASLLGLPDEHVRAFEHVDFWALWSVFFILAVSFLWRLIRLIFKIGL